LHWIVAAAASVVVALVGLAGGLLVTRPGVPQSDLEDRVENYRATEGSTHSTWLREPLQDRIVTLREFKQDSDFPKLPGGLQQYVLQRLEELEDYRSFKTALEQTRPPARARNEEELKQIEQRLKGELALPARYEADWHDTTVARLRREMLDDVQ